MYTKGYKHNDPVHNFNLKSPYPLNVDNNECWEWLGSKEKSGYGVFRLDHKKIGAHVAAFKLALGEIPDGLYVLHKCHNTCCVNPNHLYCGTQKQNVQDQIDRGTFIYGSKNGHALLTEEIVIECRASNKTCRELANQHNVSYYTMWDALKGRSWKQLK